MSNSQKLVFDIETIGREFKDLDKTSQEYIQINAEKYGRDFEEEKERLGFSPLTGEVVAIGMLNPNSNKGAIYLRGDKPLAEAGLDENIILETGTEKEVLEKFWQAIKNYNTFISFNGRGFDVPFLMVRSAILGVVPTKNLMSNRYLSSQKYDALHIDLLDQLTFYGAVPRKFNMHFWTKAFGIKSPKEDGVTGDDVGRLFKEGKTMEIAQYNLGDLKATQELYEKWEKYINV
ncbi:MAG: ribonuclease H-like domain-containing protein [bacterium]|nr:ribonuclease H-like domain-containing protein [bacterium]